jgi:monothiol glutaredoxin
MEVTERIKQHLATQPVVLFMKGTPDFPQCGFSRRPWRCSIRGRNSSP